MEIGKIGDFALDWGESLTWDDQKERLYFIDFLKSRLCWLDGARPPLNQITLTSRPTGIGLVEDGQLVIALEDGLRLIDADSGREEYLAAYPKELGNRANDATVDSGGNLVTGSLNIGANPKAENSGASAPGSYWQFSSKTGWHQLDDDITNANGPVCIPDGKFERLVFADTPAQKIFVYDYDPAQATVGPRNTYADIAELNGFPDGACATSAGGVLSCILGRGVIAHFTDNGLLQLIDAGSEQPSDACFGGKDFDQLFVVNINVDLGRGWGAPQSQFAGSLISIQNSGLTGVKENRFML